VVPEDLSAGFGDPGGGERELARVGTEQQVDWLIAEETADIVFRALGPARVVEEDQAERPARSSVADGDSASVLDVLGPETNGVQRVSPLAAELAGDGHRDPDEDRRRTAQRLASQRPRRPAGADVNRSRCPPAVSRRNSPHVRPVTYILVVEQTGRLEDCPGPRILYLTRA